MQKLGRSCRKIRRAVEKIELAIHSLDALNPEESHVNRRLYALQNRLIDLQYGLEFIYSELERFEPKISDWFAIGSSTRLDHMVENVREIRGEDNRVLTWAYELPEDREDLDATC